MDVSDIVDIDQGVMLNAFRRGCEYHMAKRMREKNAESLRADWMFELRVAMGADNKVDTGVSPLTSGYGLPMVGSTPLWWRNANN